MEISELRRCSRVVIALPLVFAPVVHAAEPAQPDPTAACRALHADKDRLACYDKLFGAPEGALVEQTPSPPAPSPAVKEALAAEETASLLDQRWELNPEQKQGTF